MHASIEHIHRPESDAEDEIKKKLRAHITKIMKKIARGNRPVATQDGHNRS
jgi:hypothetical protein